MKTQGFEFATVTRFFGNKEIPESSYGFAKNHCGESIYIGITGCRKVVAGIGKPEFGDPCQSWPRPGDKILFLRNHQEPAPGQSWGAYRWCYEKSWQQIWDEIERRPVYRVVVNSRRFKEKFEKMAPGTKITDIGTIEKLEARYPRLPDGNTNDRLGAVYKSGPVTEWQSWQRFVRMDGETEVWESCADPRSIPIAVKQPTPAPVNGKHHVNGDKPTTGVKPAEETPVPPNGHTVKAVDLTNQPKGGLVQPEEEKELSPEELLANAGGRNSRKAREKMGAIPNWKRR